jgi:hypothetical protein
MTGPLKTYRLLLIPAMCIAAAARGGGPDSTGRVFSSLTLRTGSDTALVFIDSERVGRTPLTIDSLPPGRHALRLLQTDINSWLTGSIDDTVHLAPGEHRTLQYAFDRRVMVVTDPSGAVVYMGDSIAGTTPCVLLSRSAALPSSVTVERKGYEKTVLQLPGGSAGIARAELKKIWQSEQPENVLMNESGSSERTNLKLFVAAGVAVAAGVTAAYLKIRADGQNNLYLSTGDAAFQRETHRLDTSAGVALFITEVGFAFFSYYLLSD